MNHRLFVLLLSGMLPCLRGQAPAQQAAPQQRQAPVNPNQPAGQQQPAQAPAVQAGAPQAGAAQAGGSVTRNTTAAAARRGQYVLSPGDQLVIQVAEMEEIKPQPYRVDPDGNLILPVVGKLVVAGLTMEQFEALLLQTLKQYIREPQMSVNLVEMARGQQLPNEAAPPVFLVGAFRVPGVLPLTPNMTLAEVLVRAGGIDPSAARRIRITRRVAEGTLPLKGATNDASGRLMTAEVTLGHTGEVLDPADDIDMMPYDVLQANKLEAVYVIGDLGRIGPLPVPERGTLSLTQVLALSGGLAPTAKPSKATILRAVGNSARRAEIPIDIKQVLAGRANDFPLLPNDVLVVPGASRGLLTPDRLLSTGLGVGLNALIFRLLQR